MDRPKSSIIMKGLHPYSRYGLGVVMAENNIHDETDLTFELIAHEIEVGLNQFRMHPLETHHGKKKVKFGFIKEEKSNNEEGIFLSSNVITTFKNERHIWSKGHEILEICRKGENKLMSIKSSISPTTNEFTSFSIPSKNKEASIGRGLPKSDAFESGLCTITTLTAKKPCLQYRVDKKGGRPDMYNVCIIPDLPLHKMIDFIKLFKIMMVSKLSADLYYGDVLPPDKKLKRTKYQPKKPLLYKGNFPNPPRSSMLGSIALLGSIGDFAKETEYSKKTLSILDSLKDSSIYMFEYGKATIFKYNNQIIDLAKDGNLRRIIDSLYYSKLYNQSRRSSSNPEYQKFDLFTARFLQLFNHAAFKDFLAFRAEYPNQVELLFKIYFTKMENIDIKIVKSARQLGKWLNLVAYIAARAEIKEGSSNYWEKLREQKAKVLIELESAAFSAKTGDALIAQVITRAGRLSGMDVPSEADLFMEEAMSGDLKLDQAQNLIIAFSRLKNAKEMKESTNNNGSEKPESENGADSEL